MNRQGPARASSLWIAAVTGGLIWACVQLGPPVASDGIRPVAAAAHVLAGVASLRLAVRVMESAAKWVEWWGAKTPTGKDGTALWAAPKDFRHERARTKDSPIWGRSVGWNPRPLFFDYVSSAMTVAPAGSGKGIYSVVPNCMSIRASKVIADFKGELVCMLKEPLEQRGETVRVLNPGGMWSDIVGKSDSYNPLDIIADDLNRPGGLRDVMDDLREMTTQIYPEPAEGKTENSYFREGSRRLMADAILMETMIDEYDATLSSVALLIEDRQRLEDMARWLAGVDIEGKPHPKGPFPIEHTEWAQKHDPQDVAEFAQLVRARANNLLALMSGDDRRTFDSFITGAQQALAPFAFGRIAPCMGRSTFRMEELKEGEAATDLFIVADASRMEAYKPFIGLVNFCCMTSIKRHPNKEKAVNFVLDEVTNYKVSGLESLLTWGRYYRLILHVILQNLAAF